ncbi:MAG: hypothetical protein WBM90_04590 [Acidimicrobiia bacterium]
MRRKLIALIIAVVAFSLIAASAASLGGINTADVGADTEVVASCDTDGVDVSYRFRWAQARGEYEIRRVIINGIADACLGQQISMTINHPGGTLSRGPSPINNRPGVDNNRRGWGVANGDINPALDFSIAILITG